VVVGNSAAAICRVDGDGFSGDGIEGVFADGLKKSMREIDALDVAATEPAEITDANANGGLRPRGIC